MTFEHVAMDLSQEEWKFLDGTQRLLCQDVMLENFALVASLGRSLALTPASLTGLSPSSFLQELLFPSHSQTMDTAPLNFPV